MKADLLVSRRRKQAQKQSWSDAPTIEDERAIAALLALRERIEERCASEDAAKTQLQR